MEKQTALLSRNMFIVTPVNITNLIMEMRKILRKFNGGGGDTRVDGGQYDGLDTVERRLLQWLRTRAIPNTSEPDHRLNGNRQSMISLVQPDPRQVAVSMEGYLREEIGFLISRYSPNLRVIFRRQRWGFECLCKILPSHRFAIQLPLDYPSERYFIWPISGYAKVFVDDLERGEFKLFTPLSLSTLIRVFFHRLEESLASSSEIDSAVHYL